MDTHATAIRQVKTDRTHYLASSVGKHISSGLTTDAEKVSVGVLTWHEAASATSTDGVTISVNKHPFHLHVKFSATEARLLADALLMAADDADAAATAALAAFKTAEHAYQVRLEEAALDKAGVPA